MIPSPPFLTGTFASRTKKQVGERDIERRELHRPRVPAIGAILLGAPAPEITAPPPPPPTAPRLKSKAASKWQFLFAAVAVSLITHGTIAGCVSWLAGNATSAPESSVVQTVWTGELEEPPLPVIPLESDGGNGEPGGGSFGRNAVPTGETAPSLDFDSDSLGDAPPIATLTDAPGAWGAVPDLTGANLGKAVRIRKATGAGRGIGRGIGDGIGNGVGKGDGTGAGYFGLHAKGQSFVFVVDSSGSMNHPYPVLAKTRFGRVKLELVKTIGSLTPEQKFFMIFFSDEAQPMPADRLIPASPEYRYHFLKWMARVHAEGATHPEDALILALTLEPDVIYFLTDGAFKRRVVSRIAHANTRRIPIHTIGFALDEDDTSGAGLEMLKQVAADSGGRFQEISADSDEAAQPVAVAK